MGRICHRLAWQVNALGPTQFYLVAGANQLQPNRCRKANISHSRLAANVFCRRLMRRILRAQMRCHYVPCQLKLRSCCVANAASRASIPTQTQAGSRDRCPPNLPASAGDAMSRSTAHRTHCMFARLRTCVLVALKILRAQMEMISLGLALAHGLRNAKSPMRNEIFTSAII